MNFSTPTDQLDRVSQRQIFFFTASFPGGIGEQWKVDDIEAASKLFSLVRVIPRYAKPIGYNGALPANVIVDPPLGSATLISRSNLFIFIVSAFELLFGGSRRRSELFGKIFRPRQLRKLLKEYAMGRYLARRFMERYGSVLANNDCSLLFFWAQGSALMVPHLPEHVADIVVGFHGFDLYAERTSYSYFPLRNELISRARLLAPCSKDGADYLAKSFPSASGKIVVKRLGVADFGESVSSSGGKLVIVSCAFVSPVKRLPKIVDVLSHTHTPISWYHIGGGEELIELQNYAETRLSNSNVEFTFTGSLESQAVREFLTQNEIDMFISLSSTEGVPVSIMEALSAGIPVLATRVGGVGELVDERNGWLIGRDFEDQYVAQIIDDYSTVANSEQQKKRDAAMATADRACRTPTVNDTFFENTYSI